MLFEAYLSLSSWEDMTDEGILALRDGLKHLVALKDFNITLDK